ncbi:MAG: bifunctional folylpolyglutamate synthase/dihydrofolate synthase [Ruminococcaceae bacterium]|nr:bifunctional folylpolyglutamate synthase/dihydrofolate synthase [Oscillospiraceae bacterium]
MNYQETLKYINDTPKFSKILGNDDLIKLLDALGNPQDKLSFIHIAGTNGKGSVSAMTASILEKAGYKTGLFTSPFIEEFNERIQINGENINDENLAKIATTVKEALENLSLEISVFAQITAMAFLYFAEKNCDIVVLEVGMGGKLDATNVIKTAKATVITKIGLDHTQWLGDTIEKVAEEKCGIIKGGVPVFTCESQSEKALSVITKTAKIRSCSLTVCPKTELKTSLMGEFQKENAGICVELAKTLGIDDETISKGLENTKWPARFEFLRENLIIDGGHNPDGISALVSSLKALGKKVIFVVAMMEDKNIEESAMMLSEFAQSVITTQLDTPRCVKAKDLANLFPDATVCENPKSAVETALSLAGSDKIVCVCGSLYLAGEVRKLFKQ